MTGIPQKLEEAVRCHQAGNIRQAEEAYREVLAEDPVNLDANRLLGILAYQAGRDGEAIALFENAVAACSESAQGYINLGNALKRSGRLEDAVASYRQALSIEPDDAGVHYNLGNALRERECLAESAASYRSALSINPEFVEAHSNLGLVLKGAGQLDEAIASYHRALTIDPGLAECHYNVGLALNDLGRLEESVASYESALAINPDYSEAHFALSLTLLLRGDYLDGWREYEWRWKREDHARMKREFIRPRWDGSDLDGKTIFLYAEQGDGDSIQFIRYVSKVAKYGGKVVVECQPGLRELFSSLEGIDVLIAKGERIPDFDVQASLLSLPHILKTTLATIPAEIPYLRADCRLLEALVGSEGTNIGIVWVGSPVHPKDRERSTQLSRFLGLAGLVDVSLFSLQVGDRRNDLRAMDPAGRVADLGDHLDSYARTAGAIELLDLVITVDTSVAHLAGAMGKPVWVLLPYAPDFRWMRSRTDSPWYPTMTLFRQEKIGDWPGVFAELESALASRLAQIDSASSKQSAREYVFLPATGPSPVFSEPHSVDTTIARL